MAKAAQTQDGRDRARDARLEAARERRINLDPHRMARDRRIDDAAVDAELAWEQRTLAEQAIAVAELATGEAVKRLTAEGLSAKEVVGLTGLDQRTLRRLRSLTPRGDAQRAIAVVSGRTGSSRMWRPEQPVTMAGNPTASSRAQPPHSTATTTTSARPAPLPRRVQCGRIAATARYAPRSGPSDPRQGHQEPVRPLLEQRRHRSGQLPGPDAVIYSRGAHAVCNSVTLAAPKVRR